MAAAESANGRYTAFLSYSHRDARAARWIHRRLEGYRLPGRLAGREGERGPIPRRLAPIFRDREELPAGHDLSAKVRAALARSESLVVICSRNSAASPWVAREIAAFRELHPDRPILAAIVEGAPPHCFPEGLAAGGVEPLAADLQPDRDGRRLGLLKLVAGLSGVELDLLVRRDGQRRFRRVTAVTAGALVGMLIMAVLTLMAVRARAEAERQRAQAEDMVEFMLTDLRDRLEGVGRLDVLTAVNERALAHYQGQDLDDLGPDALERRARLLQAMGEDDQRKGNLGRALSQFEEASRTTAALLEREPADPRRMFSHGQSRFWVGSAAYARGDKAAARTAFQGYKILSDRLVQIDPRNMEWLKEAAYADGNICTIALDPPADVPAALATCRSALTKMQRVAQRSPSPETAKDLANRHAWFADALRKAGRPLEALRHRRLQYGQIEKLLRQDPLNRKLEASLVWSSRAIANLEQELGQGQQARKRMAGVERDLAGLVAHDPANREWSRELAAVRREFRTMKEE